MESTRICRSSARLIQKPLNKKAGIRATKDTPRASLVLLRIHYEESAAA